MHIFFSGIGGAGIGPLALIAHQAGYEVSGSDAVESAYIKYLKDHGITNIYIGQTPGQIAATNQKRPIDWFVYSSALPKTNPDHPELKFCEQNNIKATKRDEFLNQILKDKGLKLIAVAGTHGKTTTTAMAIWLFKRLGIPVSYSLGAKIPFGEMGEYDENSEYFIYEADEFDRNFLSFYPEISLITGLDYDHPDIYPTKESYEQAFSEFLDQSDRVVLWQEDAEKLNRSSEAKLKVLDPHDPSIETINLTGLVNRLNGWLVINGIGNITNQSKDKLVEIMNAFPGVSRRFEKIAPNIYSDYAHTPPKIRGALQLAREMAGDNIIVVYEGLHNLRQHFIKDELANLFDDVKQLYVVPSYLAREDKSLRILTPADLVNLLNEKTKVKAQPAELNDELKEVIRRHQAAGDLVLCLTAGGGGSLDEWLRQQFQAQ